MVQNEVYLKPRDDRDRHDTLSLSVHYEVAHVGRAVPVRAISCLEFRVWGKRFCV
jgi:hypothetical protein